MPLAGDDFETGIPAWPLRLVARGLHGFVQNSIDIPHIVRRVQLPAFQYDIHAPYAWPRSSSVEGEPDVSH
jgi:hypothetical protein